LENVSEELKMQIQQMLKPFHRKSSGQCVLKKQ